MTKTYTAPGLIDFQMRVKAGKINVTVDFTGGRTGGEVPRWASYSTSNEVVQYLLEHSPEFKSGRIKRLR